VLPFLSCKLTGIKMAVKLQYIVCLYHFLSIIFIVYQIIIKANIKTVTSSVLV